MCSTPARLLLLVLGVLLLATPCVAAECSDFRTPDEDLQSGGIGGTGHVEAEGGIGGTGYREPRAPSGSGVSEPGGVGGTGVLGTLRGDDILCVAGIRLSTSESTTIVDRAGAEAATAQSDALQAGSLVWAVGALEGEILHATFIETFDDSKISLAARSRDPSLRRLIVEARHVESEGKTQLRAAGVDFEAPAEMVRRSVRARGAPQRIRADRGDDGRFRASALRVLTARPAPMRPAGPVLPEKKPTPPQSEPAPNRSVPNQRDRVPSPTPVRPAVPPRPSTVPAREIRPDRPHRAEMPDRPELPIRPEAPTRPERPELPPRPAFERAQPADL